MSAFELIYWHWLLIGMLLVIAEVFVTSFVFFWFGIAAFVMAALLLFVQPSLEIQLVIWGSTALGLLILWNIFLRPRWKDRTRSGMASEALKGQVGQVYEVELDPSRGKLRFAVPILGDDEWRFLSHTTFSVGDRARVVDISGNTLVIEKVG